MNIKLAKATDGGLPKDMLVRWGSLFLATVFVVMLITQLFAYETMPGTLAGYGIVDETGGLVLGAVIVILELAALPALLHMSLSKLARSTGWFAGALALDIWLVLSAWGLVQGVATQTGIFGTKIAMPLGWWSVAFLLVVGVVYIVVFVRFFALSRLSSNE